MSVDFRRLATNTATDNIIINYLDEDAGCLQKYTPIKSIASIKVNNKDMNIQYNTAYNTINNTFSISLDKVIVPKTHFC